MSTRLLFQQKPQGATWSAAAPPARRARPEDFDNALRLCSLAWVAWLLGMPPSMFSDLLRHDIQLRDRLSYAAPGIGRRGYFTDRVRVWVEAPKVSGLRALPAKD